MIKPLARSIIKACLKLRNYLPTNSYRPKSRLSNNIATLRIPAEKNETAMDMFTPRKSFAGVGLYDLINQLKEGPQIVEEEIDATYLDRDQRERIRHIRFLIRGHSKFKLRWDIVIMLLAIFN